MHAPIQADGQLSGRQLSRKKLRGPHTAQIKQEPALQQSHQELAGLHYGELWQPVEEGYPSPQSW